MSVGSVGKLGLDFIAWRPGDSYAYVQVSMPVADALPDEPIVDETALDAALGNL